MTNSQTSKLSLLIAAPNTNQWVLRASLYDELLSSGGRATFTTRHSIGNSIKDPFLILTSNPNLLAQSFNICSTETIPVVVHGGQITTEYVIQILQKNSNYDEGDGMDTIYLAGGDYLGLRTRIMLVLEVKESELELMRLTSNEQEPPNRRYFTATGKRIDPEVIARLYIESSPELG